jgi:NTE family protein
MKQKVALVLGSGGARGTAHIGVIRELEKRDYEITSIAGTSMGALVGGIYAAGKLDNYEEWLLSLSKMDIFNLVDFTLSTNGIIKADKVLREIQKFIPDYKIEELPITFAAVATDFKQKKEVILTEGSLFDAIRASISMPMVITPLRKNDTLFVDGGVLNPVPVNRVVRQKGDILIAVDVNSQIPYQKPKVLPQDSRYFEKLTHGKLSEFRKKLTILFPENTHKKENIGVGYFKLINETSNIMLSQITKLTLEIAPPDILIEISRKAYGTFDFYKSKEIIEIGKNATIGTLNNYHKKKKQFKQVILSVSKS